MGRGWGGGFGRGCAGVVGGGATRGGGGGVFAYDLNPEKSKGRGSGTVAEGVCVVVESDECPHLCNLSWFLRDRAP